MGRRRQQRARGEGSVWLEPNGGWRAGITLGDGRRLRRFARPDHPNTRDGAGRRLREMQRAVDDGWRPQAGPGPEPTVAEWVAHVIANSQLRVNSRRTYESKHRTTIAGDRQLATLKRGALQPEHIEAWLARLTIRGYAPASRRLAFRILHRAYTIALRRRHVTVNPCTLLDAPGLVRYRAQPFTLTEARRVLELASQRRNGARWAVAFALGLRPSEARGLTLDALTLSPDGTATLHIHQALVQSRWLHGCADLGSTGGEEPTPQSACHRRAQHCPQRRLDGAESVRALAGTFVLTEPKSTAGTRLLAVPPPMVPALREHLLQRKRERLAAGPLWTEHELLFTTPTGGPLSSQTDHHDWQQLLADAGLHYRRSYDTRHTCATLLAAHGVPLTVARDLLGHSQISLTADVYTHTLDASRTAAATAIGHALWDPKSAVPAC
jgi:integrase